jgi:hypothetical protein
LTPRTKVTEIEGSAVVVEKGGKTSRINGKDSVVLSLGSVSNNALLKTARGLGKPVHAVGQCRKVGKLLDAIRDGLEAGLAI